MQHSLTATAEEQSMTITKTTVEQVDQVTPMTDDVMAWLDREYPEGDASVQHTWGCDMQSVGDECAGGCAIFVHYEETVAV